MRRGVRGTLLPTLTGRPAERLVDFAPAPDAGLPGAACAEVDPDLFFPADDEAGEFVERRARQICAGCAVREMCLALALKRSEQHGIFGGLDPAERRTLARRRYRESARAKKGAA